MDSAILNSLHQHTQSSPARCIFALVVSSTSSKGGFIGPDRMVWAFFSCLYDAQAQLREKICPPPKNPSPALQPQQPPPHAPRPRPNRPTSLHPGAQPADYLKKILTARVYDVAVESALEPAKNLSRRLHNTVLLKREDQQPVFSFKLRGAYNKMAHLTPGAAQKRRDLRLGRQPCAGRGPERAQARHARGDRDADHHAAAQDRRGQGLGRRSRAARRQLLGCLHPLGDAAKRAGPDLRASRSTTRT